MGLIDNVNTDGIMHPGYYLALSGHDSRSIDGKLDSAMAVLRMNGIFSHRLKGQELHYFVVLGYGKNADPRIPMAKITCPRETKFTPLTTKQDDRQIANLVINKYPLTVPNGWMERLFSLSGTKVTMRIKPIEKEKAIKRIDYSILEIESKNAGKESEQMESDCHLDSLRDLLTDIQQSNQTLFDTVLIVTVYDKVGETTNKRTVKQALHEMGLGYTEMVGRQMEAYVSSLISKKELTKESYGIQTNSLAAGFPFQGDVRQEERGIFLGENSLPAFKDLCTLAKEKLEIAKNGYDESCLRMLINHLSRFAKGGRDSALWNGFTTFSPKENFVDFNFQKLIANRNDTVAKARCSFSSSGSRTRSSRIGT